MKVSNPFVTQAIESGGMPAPTIPAFLAETYSQYYEDIIDPIAVPYK
jgi:hypothetical protein